MKKVAGKSSSEESSSSGSSSSASLSEDSSEDEEEGVGSSGSKDLSSQDLKKQLKTIKAQLDKSKAEESDSSD